MRRLLGRTGWSSFATFFSAALMAAGLSLPGAPAQAAFELPEGEKITNVPAIPRAIPQKEAYELYDPKIGKNFDLKNFWMRADLRVRPEMRNNVCFGSAMSPGQAASSGASGTIAAGNGTGNCNAVNNTTNPNGVAGKANDFFVQQWVRLGLGYDLSPDVNFYMEIIDSATWGGNGNAANAGNGGDPLNHNGGVVGGGGNNGRLGVRAAYMLIRNFAGVQGLSVKAGRQYVIFGNHSMFGHFDWANTGYSHDGIMLQYSTKAWDVYAGWFRNSETDIGQAAATGSGQNNLTTSSGVNNGTANKDVDMYHLLQPDQVGAGVPDRAVLCPLLQPIRLGRQPGAGSRDGETLQPDPSQARKPDRNAQGQFRFDQRGGLAIWSDGRLRWNERHTERIWQPEEPAHQCLGDQKLDRLHALSVVLEAEDRGQLRLCLGRWPGELQHLNRSRGAKL